MLEAVLGSGTRARMLTILLREPRREHHLRELIRLVGGGSSGVQREVDRLGRIGLLHTRLSEDGRRLIVTNESHPLYLPLRDLIVAGSADAAEGDSSRADSPHGRIHPAVRPRLDAVIGALQAAGVRRATLFGSATQTESGAAPTDLDIVVRLPGQSRGRAARYFKLRRALERASGLPVDLVEEEAVDNPYLRQEIERTGVTLIAAA